jgi:NTP pyrophosphatase (non-canonical NTP hydrolase)
MHIREFQDMMRHIYSHQDLQRGKAGTYDWLREEVDELGEALNQDNLEALKNEFADVLAWLASLANVVNVDLEKAVLAKYRGKCPKCGNLPCKCISSK